MGYATGIRVCNSYSKATLLVYAGRRQGCLKHSVGTRTADSTAVCAETRLLQLAVLGGLLVPLVCTLIFHCWHVWCCKGERDALTRLFVAHQLRARNAHPLHAAAKPSTSEGGQIHGLATDRIQPPA
jgi:hypothetical protein